MRSKKLRNALLLAIKMSVSGCLLIFVFRKVGLQNILSHLKEMGLRFFFLSSLVYLLTLWLASLRLGGYCSNKLIPGIRSSRSASSAASSTISCRARSAGTP